MLDNLPLPSFAVTQQHDGDDVDGRDGLDRWRDIVRSVLPMMPGGIEAVAEAIHDSPFILLDGASSAPSTSYSQPEQVTATEAYPSLA